MELIELAPGDRHGLLPPAVVAIMLAGRYLFAEKLSRLRVTGILLISLGVAIVGWS